MARNAARLPRRGVWAVYALLLFATPLAVRGDFARALVAQAGIAIILCLSYNLLLGEGGMLSFGHAVYSGLGGFCAIHVLDLAAARTLHWPVALVPLAGGVAGLLFAAVLGYVTTRKAGIPFAMITLGIGELVASLSLMLPQFFGGEGGITGDRTAVEPILGVTFGPQVQVCLLVAAWCLASTAAMYAFTRTPLGRLLNAVRDNPLRVSFIGYDPQRVRWLAFMVSGFFAGVAGGLAAIDFEIVTSEAVGAARSGSLLLYTFLGGTSAFFGPILGGILMVLGTAVLSSLTKAWPIYLGLVFLVMVMAAPGGLAGLVLTNLRLAAHGRWRPLAWLYPGLAASGLLALIGASAMIEMLYHLQLDQALGPGMRFAGLALDAGHASPWIGAALVLGLGAGMFQRLWRRFEVRWADAQAALEADHRRRQESAAERPADSSVPMPGNSAAQAAASTPGAGPEAGSPALELRAVCKRFGRTEIVRGASLQVRTGERVALIGPNGAGKSTLFDLVCGQLSPSAGEILLHGRRIMGLAPHQIRRRGLARSFQVSNLFARLSVFENLRCALLWSSGTGYTCWRRLSRMHNANASADALAQRLGLARRRDTLAMDLTYAEQRTLEIGMTLAGDSEVVLLDEPTAGMSLAETRQVVHLLRELTQGRTLLVVEHDMGVVFDLADRVAVLVHGEVIAFDTPAAVRADPRVQQAYLGAAVAGGAEPGPSSRACQA